MPGQPASQSTLFKPDADDNQRLANLCGPLERNLRHIEQRLDVRITRHGDTFHIDGKAPARKRALQTLDRLQRQAGDPISSEEIELTTIGTTTGAEPAREDGSPDPEHPVIALRKTTLQGRTPNQHLYLKNILAHDISFGIGPAGTGKTWLAVACAALALEQDTVQRIVLTRPAVEAGERLGFLPGDLAQKVDPYLRPLYDALYDLIGFDRVAKLFERQAIEIAPLAYMRGRTLNHSFIILDEAQNTTPEQMKMFLTRIGFGSKAVVTGDVTQIDLPKNQPSGLIEAAKVLSRIKGIEFTHFTSQDVVRHPLVARIVEAYEKHQKDKDASEG